MPMSTQSVPHLKGATVAEARKTVDRPTARLARAAESGDAGVHNLLAQRAGYAANGLDEQVADVDRQLAELGFTAQ